MIAEADAANAPCARQSWATWNVSDPIMKQVPSKPDGVLELRSGITCPHCRRTFFVPSSSLPKNKGFYCKAHLRENKCTPMASEGEEMRISTEVVDRPPSKRSRSNDSVHRHCNQQMAEMNRRISMLEEERIENTRRWAFLGQILSHFSAEPSEITESARRHIECVNDVRTVLNLPRNSDLQTFGPTLHARLTANPPVISTSDRVRQQLDERDFRRLHERIKALEAENARLKSDEELLQQQSLVHMYKSKWERAEVFISFVDRTLNSLLVSKFCSTCAKVVSTVLEQIHRRAVEYRKRRKM